MLKGLFGHSEWQMTIKKINRCYKAPANSSVQQLRYNFYDSAMKLVMHYHEKNSDTAPDKLYDWISYTVGKEWRKDKHIEFSSKELSELPLAFIQLGRCVKEMAEQPVDHKAELLKLGFASFQSEEALRKEYKAWALENHPDKKQEAERGEAEALFKTMRIHYDAVLEAGQWANQSSEKT
jgi:hypothetical protein